MRQFIRFLFLVTSFSALAYAQWRPAAPEIDPASGSSALTLVAGGLFIVRARRAR